uniref:NADH dehydrogenase subunit 2 n=1 Tax=Pedinomonas minor TaxID=3159 RepID=Q9ZY23_PEDMN|nr:NADH dehydrogenase subunit 2 [Pedinomonas minor]AAD19671.1 NADH dehydrogenase subunit 2 [Pedinomonas minor]
MFIENILINLLLINFFLPLAFLNKRFFYINFPFLLSILYFAYIYFSVGSFDFLTVNSLWWFFLILMGLNVNTNFNYWEWWLTLTFVLIGLNILLSGFLFNFLGLFMILELQAMIFLILVQADTFSLVGVESSAKWAILNALFSLFLITGFVLAYIATGTINFVDIYFLDINEDFYLIVGIILLVSSLLFKIALPPFHFWLPDVYENSNFILIILLIGPLKLFYIIFFSYLISLQSSINNALFYFGILSIITGFFLSLNQLTIKKFLAWTGIFYFGVFILILNSLTLENLFILKLYVIIYIFSSYFLVSYVKFGFTKLSDLMFLFNDNLFSALVLLGIIMIIIGLPIISGFFGKLIFYYSLIVNSSSFLYILIILFFTSFAFYYYLTILIYGLSIKPYSTNVILLNNYSVKANVFIYFLFLLNFLLFLFPSNFSLLFLYFN